MTARSTFTEADVRRVVKGAKAAGMSDFILEVTKDKIRLLPETKQRKQKEAVEVLPEKW